MTEQLNQIQAQDLQLIWIGGNFSHLKATQDILWLYEVKDIILMYSIPWFSLDVFSEEKEKSVV